MNNYTQFFIDFMSPFFNGLISIFKSLGIGLIEMFNVLNYIDVINNYKDELSGGGLFIVVIAIIVLLLIYGIVFVTLFIVVKRMFRYRRNRIKQEAMIDEIERLNVDVVRLKEENQKFLTMAGGNAEPMYDEEGKLIEKQTDENTRFYKLTRVDERMMEFQAPTYNKELKLEEIVKQFRNFSASKLELYYDEKLIKLFLAALSSNRLIILQGISGTGKTSLAYAFGQFINNETTVASVQPSWRDSTELFGYFNEFTKKYNETEVLSKIYEALYREDVYITLLDEMNISRVEYYFAEMLSILELPNKKDWVLDLVPNAWDNDPKKIVEGKIQLPTNMWYIGTINNDDSTFMVTDKVYDRAMPINIDNKCDPFNAPETEGINLSSPYLLELFAKAQEEFKVGDDILHKIDEMDKYVIEHFRLAFGNRIVKHIREFVPVYIACGGTLLEGLDYVMANKILRKFDQLNLSLIKDEIDGYIDYLNQTFGDNTMVECIAYLERLKKTI